MRILNLTNRMWLSVVCTLIDNVMRHHSGRNVVDSLGCAPWVHNILTTVMTHINVDKSTDNAKPHSICFLPQYRRQRKCFFFRAWPRAWHIDFSSVVWTLIDNGKLANQIARLVAIAVKYVFHWSKNCFPLVLNELQLFGPLSWNLVCF